MTFVEVLNAAKDTRDAEEFVARVKSAVTEELTTLDSSVEIEDTRYFNHSAIPDLVLKWPREKSHRAIFLRHSYQSVIDADDIEYLASDEPVFLSLDTRESEDLSAEKRISESSGVARTLLTDPSAIDVLRTEGRESSPLTELVRANFMRGGRGLIDQPRATSLVDSSAHESAGQSQIGLIAENFVEDAAARITRTAQLIELALEPDFEVSNNGESPLVRGKLSIAELRHLVPWLLHQERAVSNAGFWRHLGEYVTFAELESIRADLADLDLTPLISANADRWSAKRAYVGLAVPSDDDDTYESRSDYWSFRGGAALGIDIGEHRLSLSNNGQLLKARDNTSSATWDHIKTAVAQDRISRIDLRGISRSVILSAERSPDIRADVHQVTDSLDDSYRVSEVAIRTTAPDGEGAVEIEVNFDDALTSSSGASIADLARISMQVMNYRAPITDEELNSILGKSSVTSAESDQQIAPPKTDDPRNLR